ncbi:hypothetical protein [Planococcus faecalis]|uniref:Uncharacterized protein n=1 Tax=Planococcus faecalis TaxID=1598147 RepID=A0ABM6IT31_9BACL|nr:hypothetical protein [Planococcus faecalis]AQU79743.1 hypothetical protein AJGP001_10910 [Planococcus faecalis]
MKLKYLFTIPLKTLWYGALCHYHANKAIKFVDYHHVLGYHRDMVTYYHRLAFNKDPKFKGDKS